MRKRLLKWLACPICGNELYLEHDDRERERITEGILYCQCGQVFPVIRGVPRLLCGPLKKELLDAYPDFFSRHSELFDHEARDIEKAVDKKKRATMNRFGYEWKTFSDYKCNNFMPFIAPLPPGFFQGKLGLDVGCGAGRHARQAMEQGAEIVGIDLSQAVDIAQDKNADNARVHIVQADIYNMPFKPGSFDFIFSLGVLQHLPDPEMGYQALIPLLNKNGSLFIWVYAYSLRKVVLELLRFIAKRLSNEGLRRMAYSCNLIDYGIFVNLYRFMEHLPVFCKLAKRYSPLRVKEYARYDFQVGYADWFDRLSAPITNYYKRSEMQGWLKRSGLHNTRLLLEEDSWWWLYGERKADHEPLNHRNRLPA